MRFATALSTAASLLALAHAANFTVDVGLNGLAYTPSSVTAAVGDIITFTFHPKNHTLTQSTFATPCTPAFDATTGQQGFDTGFVPVAAGSTSAPMSIRVTTATPLWFFCKQTGHCTQGMVFAINPTANKTFAQYQANAMAQPATGGAPAAGSSSVPVAGSSVPGGVAGSSSVAPGAAAPTDSAAGGYGGLPTDTGASTPGVSGVSGSAAPGATGTGAPNAAGALSPRGVAFVLAALAGAGMLL